MRGANFRKKSQFLRKFNVRVLLLFLTIWCLGNPAYGNPVNNPSMEGNFIYQDPLGDVAEYWTGWRDGYGYVGVFSAQTYDAHDGSKSQQIHWYCEDSDYFDPAGLYQQISSLQPGQVYRVSVWFRFCLYAPESDENQGEATCSVGIDPNGGTNIDVVTNWGSTSDVGYGWDYCSPWFDVVTVFSATNDTATLFIKAQGQGEGWLDPPEPWPAVWEPRVRIDDVNVESTEVGLGSTVEATTPVPGNGFSYSEVTITVVDPNGSPIEGIPASAIDVNCTGSGNILSGPDTPTDENGQTTARIITTEPETKTVSATVLGTVLSDTAMVQFCQPSRGLTKLWAADAADSDWFGYSVSISGDYAIVGAHHRGGNSGLAYIFKCSDEPNDPKWYQQDKLTASDGHYDDYFAYSVSISGDYAIAGAYGDDDNGSSSGSAYIFRYNGSNWIQQAKLLAFDGASSDYFGYSVAINENTAIVGAYKDDDNGSSSGSAYIFTPNDVDPNNWDQQAKLTAPDGAASDYFGYSVSISRDYAIVGARGDDDNGSSSGSAYIFAPNSIDPSNWVQQAKLTASDGASGDNFGCSVSISGDYAVVGADLDDDNGSSSGSAYIFRYDGLNWLQQDKLLASDGAWCDYFGRSVSISGDYAIVGAYSDDDNGPTSGSAYIFTYDGLNWLQQDKLLASDGASSDYFGRSVSISGDYAIAGSYGDDDNGSASGSAYIFALLPDVDGDGDVDLVDFSILAVQWLQLPGQPSADIAPCGGDCAVDFLDFTVIAEHWLEGTGP